MPVESYAASGREVEVPRPDCPSCSASMSWWSGYRRHVRVEGVCHRIFVPRVRCGSCEKTHALLPAFVLVGRLDVAETVGQVIAEVATGGSGVRPPAARLGVPHTTARGWCRRFAANASRWAVALSALAVELGEDPVRPLSSPTRWALDAVGAAWRAATGLPGWVSVGVWRFVSAVTGGRLIVGSRRFMPPTP